MSNTLEDFYRTKDIYIKLPSGGKWYKNKPKLSVSEEMGIMPMTARDEMILKIPDSLYNSESLFSVVKSVAPDIDDPYEICLPDLDAILIATRVVTQGNNMNVTTKCPKCSEVNDYTIDIPTLLSKIKPITEEIEIQIKKLKLKLKPNTLAIITASNIENVEISRLKPLIVKAEKDGDYSKSKDLVQESFNRIAAANLTVVADMIESVTTPDGKVVTDFLEILKWIQNLDLNNTEKIKSAGSVLNSSGIPRKHKFVCGNETCSHAYETEIEFNPTFFFTPS